MERVEKTVEVPVEEEPNANAQADTKMDTGNQNSESEKLKSEPMTTDASPTPPNIGAESTPEAPKPKTRIEVKNVLHPRDVPVSVISMQLSHEQLMEFTDFQVPFLSKKICTATQHSLY